MWRWQAKSIDLCLVISWTRLHTEEELLVSVLGLSMGLWNIFEMNTGVLLAVFHCFSHLCRSPPWRDWAAEPCWAEWCLLVTNLQWEGTAHSSSVEPCADEGAPPPAWAVWWGQRGSCSQMHWLTAGGENTYRCECWGGCTGFIHHLISRLCISFTGKCCSVNQSICGLQ